MFRPFVYDERSSELFNASGERLGAVWCAGALHWNQLSRTPPRCADACCGHCGRPMLDLAAPDAARQLDRAAAQETLPWCLYASEGAAVVVLKDPLAPPPLSSLEMDPTHPSPIHTVRGLLNINRSAGMGYWPDVRLVRPAVTKLRAMIGVLQRPLTGEVRLTHDGQEWERLLKAGQTPVWEPLIAPTSHYPYAQREPLAAYAVPPNLPDGTPLLVRDPIEDVVGSAWSRGDVLRAEDVPGVLQGRQVVLHPSEVKTAWIIGSNFPARSGAWG